jgi:hypothetical protein
VAGLGSLFPEKREFLGGGSGEFLWRGELVSVILSGPEFFKKNLRRIFLGKNFEKKIPSYGSSENFFSDNVRKNF